MTSINVLITGANGFIGSELCKTIIKKKNFNITRLIRSGNHCSDMETCIKYIDDIDPLSDWTELVFNQDVVIHLAGIAHNSLYDKNPDEYFRVNYEGTANLAKQAAANGVKRFIFVSSIKVNGDMTLPGSSFSIDSKPAPVGPYAISKHYAETALMEISKKTNMEYTILRPSLVYGPGVKGNIQTLIRLLDIGIPMPFASLRSNSRSFLGVHNLIDLLITCITNPKARNKIFLASDGIDFSSQDLMNTIAKTINSKSLIFPFPVTFLRFFGKILKIDEKLDKLINSQKVDISYTKEVLGWEPSKSFIEGLKDMIKHNNENKLN